MNKVYLIAPLAALVVFAAVQQRHARDFATREAETQRLTLAEREAREQKERMDREAARESALAAAEARRLEAAEKKRIADAERQARADNRARLESAIAEEAALRRQLAAIQVERVEAEQHLARERERVRQLELEKADHDRAIAFNRSMQRALERVRDEIEAADARRQLAANPPSARP